MKREIMAEILEKKYEILCEVESGEIDLNSIKNEMQKIIGYEISSIRFKDGKIVGILLDEKKQILLAN